MSPVRFTRKKVLIGLAAAAAGTLGARAAVAAAFSYPEGAAELRVRFASLDQALAHFREVATAGAVRTTGEWSWAQILEHCAQGIEYSLVGYPEQRGPFFQRTVGRRVLGRFASQGYMKHDLAAVIPGAPALAAPGRPELAFTRLETAVAAFHAHPGPLAPHFVYGELSRPEYDRAHAMHLANHLHEVG